MPCMPSKLRNLGLRRIADQLEQGVVTEGGLHLSMPDLAEFELEVEPDELEIKIEWR